jgi:DNA-binding response OmpR family regulator
VEKIAVVDDDADIRRLIELRLLMAGFTVLTAGDGGAGLKLIRAEKPSVVILDSIMPGMSGYAVCRAIRTDPELRGTFIIIASGSHDPAENGKANELGADVYLTKPYSMDMLLEKIKTSLACSRATAE